MPFSFGDWEVAEFIQLFKRSRPKWYDYAACHGAPLEYFFAGQGQKAYVQRGLDICAACPVREKCFKYAMTKTNDHPDQDFNGIWGGSTPAQRLRFGMENLTPGNAWKKLLREEALQENEA